MKKHARHDQGPVLPMDVPVTPKPTKLNQLAKELIMKEKRLGAFAKACETLMNDVRRIKGELAQALRTAGETARENVRQLLLPLYNEQGWLAFTTNWVNA